MTNLIEIAKAEASGLMQLQQSLGNPISRSKALELVAKQHNFSDWNRYRAYLARHPTNLSALITVVTGMPMAGKSQWMRRYSQAQVSAGARALWVMPYKATQDPDLLDAFQGYIVLTLHVDGTTSGLLDSLHEQLKATPNPLGWVFQSESSMLHNQLSWIPKCISELEQLHTRGFLKPDLILMDEVYRPDQLLLRGDLDRLSSVATTGRLVVASQFDGQISRLTAHSSRIEVVKLNPADTATIPTDR